MAPVSAERLQRYARVLVAVGLNLQPGQRLLLTDPFQLHGVHPDLAPLVDAVRAAAAERGAADCRVLWGDEERLRAAARRWPDEAFDRTLREQTAVMQGYADRGDALLFLESSLPGLCDGLEAASVAALTTRGAELYGRVAPALLAARTNWTVAPAPTARWAAAVHPDLEGAAALTALWHTVLAACRADHDDPVAAWQAHLGRLRAQCDGLNATRPGRLRFTGEGTDLEVVVPPDHRWCAASLATAGGVVFSPNLPTEEIFTAPHARSAEGRVRIARGVTYGGALIDGIELEFRGGKVVRASARAGNALLREALATDRGASYLGEIAIVPVPTVLAEGNRTFFHALLDENAMNHIALGDAYAFCAPGHAGRHLNHSRLHLDLPIAAAVEFA